MFFSALMLTLCRSRLHARPTYFYGLIVPVETQISQTSLKLAADGAKVMLMQGASKHFALISMLFIGFVNCALAQTSSFSKLVVFGDSISDTGNLAVVDLPFPFFENRISNGPVLVDFIAASIDSNANRSGHLLGESAGFNYAVSGGNIVGSDPEDLNQQVSAFLDRGNQQADPDALYVVIMGGNDLRGIRSIADAAIATTEINAVITELNTQITRLSNAGARAFLIANVPNVGRIPETLALLPNDPNIVTRTENRVREYNLVFSQMLTEFTQRADLSVVEFDLFQALEDILDNPASFGFNNIEQGCFDSSNFSIDPECVLFGFDTRVFFDNIHPSAATNEIVAPSVIAVIPPLPSQVSDDVQNQAVFIPAILQLLLEQTQN